MHVPTATGRFAFAGGFTAVSAGYLLLRQLAGQPDAIRRHTVPWAINLARGIGMRVRVHGAENVDPAETAVFVSNHQSHLDIVALFVALPVQPGFLAKRELRRIPVFGKAMEVSGHVFVDRFNRERAFEAITRAAEQVRAGRPIVIFPEGTRSEREVIRTFKKGGFHLAKQARVPVIPVGVRGTARLLPKNRRLIHPGSVDVHIGVPIPPEQFDDRSVDELIDRVRREISRLSALPLMEDVQSSRG